MKRIAILFACVLSFALSSCDENQQVIHILSAPSELDSLEITAYADDIVLAGGTSLSPGFQNSVFDYTVYVAKDANRFSIHAGTDKEATVSAVCINDGETGLEFDFIGDADKTIHLTVQIKHMERTDYRLTIVRGEPNAVARNIEIWVEPRIGSFFVGSGVIPKVKVTADLPPQGGVLSYQWYVNDQNTSRGGSLLSGATGDTYTMQRGETLSVRTVYYYVEITNTIGGRAAVTESVPCKVTFLNKYDLDDKSLAMVAVPSGRVNADAPEYHDWTWGVPSPWSTPGFSMGQNPVTWELWKTVFDYASVPSGNYYFARSGNQGAAVYGAFGTNDDDSTNRYARPIGSRLNPVTAIGWRDAVVWCNAYSEMDGLEPVYRDSKGNVLRDSRMNVEWLVDNDAVENAGYNGYRLPTMGEWQYAARGTVPSQEKPTYYLTPTTTWGNRYPGTNDEDERKYYMWSDSPGTIANQGILQTGEVGSLRPLVLPNGSELYDLMGMVYQWVWWPSLLDEGQYGDTYLGYAYACGSDIVSGGLYYIDKGIAAHPDDALTDSSSAGYWQFAGFRLARNKD